MGLLNFFRKKTPEEVFRKKVRGAFEESVKDAKRHLMGNALIDGMLVQAAIGNTRQALLNAPELQMLGLMSTNWMPEDVIDQECKRVMKKYLE